MKNGEFKIRREIETSGGMLTVVFSSDDVVSDKDIDVVVDGLTPNDNVDLSLSYEDDETTLWTSTVSYTASPSGVIDSKVSIPRGETLADPSRLFWSVSPRVGDVAAYLEGTAGRYGRPYFKTMRPVECVYSLLRDGEQFELGRVTRRPIADGVRIEKIVTDEICGNLYRPVGMPKALVVVIPGSGGGVDSVLSPLLASNDCAVLALALFNWSGRPKYHHNVPIEYISNAVEWACKTCKIPRAVLIGSSRGSEAVMLTAALAPSRIAGVVPISPGSIVTAGWTPDEGETVPSWSFRDQLVPFFVANDHKDMELPSAHRFEPIIGQDVEYFEPYYEAIFSNAYNQAHYPVPVEKITAPTLLLSGEKDEMWAAKTAGAFIEQRIKNAQPNTSVEHVLLPETGHFILARNTVSSLSTFVLHPVEKNYYGVGGSPMTNARGNATAWEYILQFVFDVS